MWTTDRLLADRGVQWLVLAMLFLRVSAQESPQEVEIIKQINRVNDDGSYTFGYEAADGSFKIETRDVLGNVKGMFGFVDENGELKRVSYTANNGTGERPLGLSGYTTVAPRGDDVTGRPVLVLAQPADPTRAPVIQHIPRRQGTRVGSASSTTTPVYGDYLRTRRPHTVFSTRTSAEVTTATPRVSEDQEEDAPTHIPLGKIVVTKRPLGRGGNNLRRQLANVPDTSSGDVSDVYSGGAAVPRYFPAQSVRSPQSPLLANLPPHLAAAVRQQQIARAAGAFRPYSPGADSYPIPSPRPAVIDDEEYLAPTRQGTTAFPPVRGFYRPAGDGPVQVPFPMNTLRSLRDELMEYILQYLQFRLGNGNPYSVNPYNNPYQSPFFNTNFPYQNPVNFGGANPNGYNPYFYPNTNFVRNPYQPPFGVGPSGYPGLGGYPGPGTYPGPTGYTGPNFPQPLPFSSPNKQQAAQQYGPSQRSAPSYEQFTPSSVQSYEPQRGLYERQRDYESAQRNDQAETRGSSDSTTYSLPPSDVLRMILARNAAGVQSTTSTSAPTTTTSATPVRSVQILGASSSLSTTTARPAPRQVRHNLPEIKEVTTEAVDEMEMQA